MAKTKVKTVDEYIEAYPEEVQVKLREMRACIREDTPKAREELKWEGRSIRMMSGY